jgi:hypothetical protein
MKDEISGTYSAPGEMTNVFVGIYEGTKSLGRLKRARANNIKHFNV